MRDCGGVLAQVVGNHPSAARRPRVALSSPHDSGECDGVCNGRTPTSYACAVYRCDLCCSARHGCRGLRVWHRGLCGVAVFSVAGTDHYIDRRLRIDRPGYLGVEAAPIAKTDAPAAVLAGRGRRRANRYRVAAVDVTVILTRGGGYCAGGV